MRENAGKHTTLWPADIACKDDVQADGQILPSRLW